MAPFVCNKSCLNNNSNTTEASLMKIDRKIKHNEKICRAQDLEYDSYIQDQGHS